MHDKWIAKFSLHAVGRGYVNKQGVDYYNGLIDYMIEKGIEPYANLYHYDLPDALEKMYGGLLNKRVV